MANTLINFTYEDRDWCSKAVLRDGEDTGMMLVLGDLHGMRTSLYFPCGEYIDLSGPCDWDGAINLMRTRMADIELAAVADTDMEICELYMDPPHDYDCDCAFCVDYDDYSDYDIWIDLRLRGEQGDLFEVMRPAV